MDQAAVSADQGAFGPIHHEVALAAVSALLAAGLFLSVALRLSLLPLHLSCFFRVDGLSLRLKELLGDLVEGVLDLRLLLLLLVVLLLLTLELDHRLRLGCLEDWLLRGNGLTGCCLVHHLSFRLETLFSF